MDHKEWSVVVSKGRTAGSASILAMMATDTSQRLGTPQFSAFGPARRTLISAAVRSTLGYWASTVERKI